MYHSDKSIESTELLDKRQLRKQQKEAESRERWIRRGHTRKPNSMVRALYWIFDKIGDFKYMIVAFFRWIGRVSVGIGNFLMNSALFLVNLFILVGTITLSVGHSHEMLIYAGMAGWMAWIAVAVWESAFIYSSFVIESDFKKGRPAGLAPWVGFIMGFIFVEISNYMGMADNIIGKSIGISTPILLLVSKGIMAHQFKSRKNEQAVTQKSFSERVSQMFGKSPKTETKSGDHTTQNEATQSPKNEVKESPETVTPITQNEITLSPEIQAVESTTLTPKMESKSGDDVTSNQGDNVAEDVTRNEEVSQEEITSNDKTKTFDESNEKLDVPITTEEVTTSSVTQKGDENEEANHPITHENQVEAITKNEVETVTQNDVILDEEVTSNAVTQSPEIKSKSGDDVTQKSIIQSPQNESKQGDHTTQNKVIKKKLVTQKPITKVPAAKKKHVTRNKVVSLKSKRVQAKIEAELKNSKKKDEIEKAITYIFKYESENQKSPTIKHLEEIGFTNHQAKEAKRVYGEIVDEIGETG